MVNDLESLKIKILFFLFFVLFSSCSFLHNLQFTYPNSKDVQNSRLNFLCNGLVWEVGGYFTNKCRSFGHNITSTRNTLSSHKHLSFTRLSVSLSLLLWAFHLFRKVAPTPLLPPLNGPQQLRRFLRIVFNSPCRVIWAISEMQALFFSSSSMVLPMKWYKALTLPPPQRPPYTHDTCLTAP